MKAGFALLALTMLVACDGYQKGGITGHVPLTVGRVTYQWPIDSTTEFDDLGRPENWRGSAYIPAGIWNEMMSPVPEVQRSGWKGQLTLRVAPARISQWNIQPNGKGLPLFSDEHFEETERGKGFTIGKGVGKGIVNPPVLVTFDGEKYAYAQCSAPEPVNPPGTCNLLLNDRGVEHLIPLGWGNWKRAKTVLLLYRTLVGIPQTADR